MNKDDYLRNAGAREQMLRMFAEELGTEILKRTSDICSSPNSPNIESAKVSAAKKWNVKHSGMESFKDIVLEPYDFSALYPDAFDRLKQARAAGDIHIAIAVHEF